MTVSNPLAPGVYRIDLPCEAAATFGRWRRAQRGKVAVIELEDGPAGKARISFVVFQRPGAFPFGKLGKPEAGEVVGALPDWTDVVQFALRPIPGVQLALEAVRWGKFFADHARPEFAELRDAVTKTRADVAVIRAQLELVAAGKSSQPAAVLHNAAAMVAASMAHLLDKAGAIPLAYPRQLVNTALEKLDELGAAIKAAPGKALHAVSKFPGLVLDNYVKPFLIPAELAALGVAALLAGGYFTYANGGKMDNLSRNLMLAGAAVAVLGGTTFAANLANLFPKDDPK